MDKIFNKLVLKMSFGSALNRTIIFTTISSLFLIFLFAAESLAYGEGTVGLGLGFGASIPIEDELEESFIWGFYVDIPLISTFHITPSAEVYKFENSGSSSYETNATDMSLAFKFIVPLHFLSFYAGVPIGVTNAQFGETDKAPVRFHVGGVVGASFNIISNIDLFGQFTYKIIMSKKDEEGNINNARLLGGFLFHFE